jgi:hypothetical protein
MAQAKYIQYLPASATKAAHNPMGIFHRPMPLVSMSSATDLKATEMLAEPQGFSVIQIPRISPTDEDVLETTYLSQLDDGRLIYCYQNGEIDLYTTSTSEVLTEKLSVLPEGKTTAVYELPGQRLLICREDKNILLVDLNLQSGIKMDLPSVEVTSVLAEDQNSVFIGTNDGRLLHWHLGDNKLIGNWSIETETPILSLAATTGQDLFLILHNEKGFLTGLFNPKQPQFQLDKQFDYDDFQLIGETIVQVSYDPQANPQKPLSFITRSEIQPSALTLYQIKDNETETQLLSNNDKSYRDSKAFVLPNGNLAFSGYRDFQQQTAETANKNHSSFVLEVQEFSFSDTLQRQTTPEFNGF